MGGHIRIRRTIASCSFERTRFGHSSAGPCLGVGAEGREVARHCATPKGCETCVNLPRLRLVPQVLFQT